MTRQYVDRGEPLKGINRTLRDARTPYNLARSLENFSLPDSRLRRRTGFKEDTAARNQGNWASKHTGSTLVGRVGNISEDRKANIYKTPLSYGVLRYHDNWKLTLGGSWTREFVLKLGDKEALVTDPFKRIAHKSPPGADYEVQLRTEGVFVFDQTLLSNFHSFQTGAVASPGSVVDLDEDHTNDLSYHVHPLTTMAISYTETKIQVEMGVVEKTASGPSTQKGVYWPREINLSKTFSGSGYTVGSIIHVAVRYDFPNTKIELLVDGIVEDSYTFGAGGNADVTNFALIGEYDNLNGEEYTSGLGRDIVLLNECTARASYQSAVKIQTNMNGAQTFHHSYDSVLGSADDDPMPWCCSPPRGTAMRALRFWNVLRSTANILLYSRTDSVETSPTGLIGNWLMNDGSGVIQNLGTTTGMDVVLHHGYPTYVSENWFLHDLGIRLSDGQHLIFRTSEISQKYVQDAALPLIVAFQTELKETQYETTGTIGNIITNPGFDDVDRIKTQHDVTVQIQFKTPPAFQLELNKATTGALLNTAVLNDDYTHQNIITARESRRSMIGTNAFNLDMMGHYPRDGGHPEGYSVGSSGYRVPEFKDGRCIDTEASGTDWDNSRTTMFFFRSYDQTLFSIEAHAEDTGVGAADNDNLGARTRVPLIRGLITPEGKLAFECFLAGDINTELTGAGTNHTAGRGDAIPVAHRVIGETVLTANRVYTATFIKRATYNKDSGRPGAGAEDTIPNGMVFEIWLQDIEAAAAAVQEWSATPYKREILHRSILTIARVGSAPFEYDVTMAANHPLNFNVTGERNKIELRGVKATTGAHQTTSWNGVFDGYALNATTGVRLKMTGPPDGLLSAGTAGMFLVFNGSLRSSFCRHKPVYDVVVGASQVNDGFDRSITLPDDQFGASGGNPRDVNWKNYLVPQRFMSPYQDQPGNFTVSFFRVWAGVALSGKEISEYGDKKISTKDYSPHLVINAEIEENAGNRVLNKCRYPGFLRTGYKSWGAPQSAPFKKIADANSSIEIKEDAIPGAWMMEDCIGYELMHEMDTVYFSGRNAICNGLAPFQTTLTQSYGLLVVFDDHVLLDTDLTGSYIPLYITGHGLLNDFSGKGQWRGTNIGDRTVLTSDTGLPKVFNGKTTSIAGFKDWTGGTPSLVVVTGVDGQLADPNTDLFYGIRVVYNAEEYSIQHMSETQVVKIFKSSAAAKILIYDVPPHYDPRVTAIQFYRTRGQTTRELAESADLFPIFEGSHANMFQPLVSIIQPDTKLFPAPLDRFRTPLPICRYGASMNGRLYLSGNIAIPDAVYFSDGGNPESFDTLFNVLILEEGSGDKITGMVAMFGILFVFKANSVWRVEEVGGAQHQVNQVASVGPVSDDSLEVFTIPETGRTAIFFWSQYGPYMMDGSVLQYLGFGIEDDGTHANPEYSWLDPASVVTLHDVRNKEIICFYKTRDEATEVVEDRRSEALVFNYRFQVWYRFTGMVATKSLAASFTGNVFSDTVEAEGVNPADPGFIANYNNIAVAYIGASNGKLYKWGEDSYDGAPAVTTVYQYAIDSISGNNITIKGGSVVAHDFIHLWVTVYHPRTGEWSSHQVQDNTTTVFTLYDVPADFTTSPNDTLYLTSPPASAEFPWDIMDVPLIDKEIVELITWHNKNFFFRMAKDWDSADLMDIDPTKTHQQWHNLDAPDVANGRRRTQIAKMAEATKLELVSFEIGSSIDAFAYHIDYKSDGVVAQ